MTTSDLPFSPKDFQMFCFGLSANKFYFKWPVLICFLAFFISFICFEEEGMESKFFPPENFPVAALEIKDVFEQLSEKEKLYAYHFTQAAWAGLRIAVEQLSPESPKMFDILVEIFKDGVTPIKEKCISSKVTEEELTSFLNYCGLFLANCGNHLSFGDTKFIPRLSQDRFREIIALLVSPKHLIAFDSVATSLFSTSQEQYLLGYPGKGVTAYYSPNVTLEDIEHVQQFGAAHFDEPAFAYNTRVFKDEDGTLVLRIAAAATRTETHTHEGKAIRIEYGDYSSALSTVTAHLTRARAYARSETQASMIDAYIAHFTQGDIALHKDAQRFWVKDVAPPVETNMGFIESYRDPHGVRGEFEAFTAVVDKKKTLIFAELVREAATLLTHLPWPSTFEKERFILPDFTSLDVLSFVTSGIPIGINIPNYNDVKATDGFKNVMLSNVVAARLLSDEDVPFVPQSHQSLFHTHARTAMDIQVGLHELLGHGSGRLLAEAASGALDFDPAVVVSPLTGKPVTSWYKPGQSYESQFGAIGRAMEEWRAEMVALFLSHIPSVQRIFHLQPEAADDVIHVSYLSMMSSALKALEFYDPVSRSWSQAHCWARYAIFSLLREAGAVSLAREGDSDVVVISPNALHPEGAAVKALGEHLARMQVYRATADVAAATALFTGLTTVDEEMLAIRDRFLKTPHPRCAYVQAGMRNRGGVEVVLFPPTVDGLIDSIVLNYRYSLHTA